MWLGGTQSAQVKGISEDSALSGPGGDLRLGLFLGSGCWLSSDQIFIFNDLENFKSFPLRI